MTETPDRLDESLVDDALTALPDWEGDASALTRTVPVEPEAADKLMASVGELAAALDHDPRVEMGEGRVRFVLTTEEVGGVTAVDVAMASRIDDLVAHATGVPAEHPHHEPLGEEDEEA